MPPTAARDLAGKLIAFLETGAPPDGLFAPDVFCDFTLPQWRLQAQGAGDVVALRSACPGASASARTRGRCPRCCTRRTRTRPKRRAGAGSRPRSPGRGCTADIPNGLVSSPARPPISPRALARVAQQDAALARLFRDTVRTGAVCRYDPDPARPVRWLLDG
jgi:hypothetical protein